jgi:hypothetical protein
VTLRIDADEGESIAELSVAGSGNLLYTGAMNERLVGMEAWESFFTWQDGGSDDVRTELVRGPAVERVEVAWLDGVDMSGTTTWTFHAGGRIYRREDATLATSPSGANVTAYVALDDSAITHVDWAGNGAAVPITFAPGAFDMWAQATPSEEWLCAYHETAGHEIGLLADATTSHVTRGVRITRSQASGDDAGATAQLALQYDWNLFGDPAEPGDYSGNFQVIVGPSAGKPCVLTSTADQAWRNPPGLTFASGGTIGTAPPGEDENGDGFAEGGGYWAVDWSSSPLGIELASAGSVPATVTFRIDGMPPGDPLVTLEHDEETTRLVHGRDYLIDEGGGFTWLVVRAPLGSAIQIDSPPVP